MSEAAPIEELELLPECQARHELNADAVEEYAEAYRTGDKLPPVDVFLVDGRKIVVDGFHRVAAGVKAGLDFLRFEVVGEGELDAASWHASGVNKRHGVRRSSSDKRRAVWLALDGFGAEQSNRVVADHVGVSRELVRTVREAWEAEHGATETRTGADGKAYPAKVAGNATSDAAEAGGISATCTPSSPPPAGGTDPEEGDEGPLDGVSDKLAGKLEELGWREVTGGEGEDPPSSPQGREPWTAEPMPEDEADLEELAERIRAARLLARKLLEAEGPRTSLRQRVEDHLERAEQACRLAVAAVCPECQGDGCPRCGRRGWATKGTVAK